MYITIRNAKHVYTIKHTYNSINIMIIGIRLSVVYGGHLSKNNGTDKKLVQKKFASSK